MEIRSVADSLSAEFPLTKVCKVFEVPRSSVYEARRRTERCDPDRARLKAQVVELHTESRGAAGSRTLSARLKAAGEPVGRFKARSLMRECGLQSKQPPGRHYRKPESPSEVAPNILDRQFEVEAPNRVWCSDVTYIRVGGEWLYLAIVLDLYARRVVGWALSDSPDSALTCQALRLAFELRGHPTGVLMHTDQGCHFTSDEYRSCLRRLGIRHSMSRRGNCWDNSPMERFFRSLKTEWLPANGYSDVRVAIADITDYVSHYYNWKRPHTHADYKTPAAFEAEQAA